MENYEKIEKIVAKTGVSEEDAKAALESCGYDLLDAMLILERAGKIRDPKTAKFTTGDGAASEEGGQTGDTYRETRDSYRGEWDRRREERERQRDENKESVQRAWESFKHFIAVLWKYCARIAFVVERKGQEIISLPLVILIIAVLFTQGSVFFLLLLGLFFGCRYYFLKDGRKWPGEKDEPDTDH